MFTTCVEVEDRGFGIIRVRVTPRALGQFPLAYADGTRLPRKEARLLVLHLLFKQVERDVLARFLYGI
jgi:hypothetical protein